MPRAAWVRGGVSLALLAAATALAPPAHANGRFPRGQRLLEDPADPNHLVLAATYGLLVSADRGKSWHFICEMSFAELGAEADPMVSLSSDGSLIASLYSNLSVGEGGGCDFRPTLGEGKYVGVPDFTSAGLGSDDLLAAVVSDSTGSMPSYAIFASDDGGRSWSERGTLPPELSLLATLDVAPSDPNRVYVTGLAADDTGMLLRSDDGGHSFEVRALPTDSGIPEVPYIAAVDPQNRDVLYVRTDAWVFDPADGISWASDSLLYSDDGGDNFAELMRTGGKLLGFALSPDGSEVLLGYGDPVEGGGRLVRPTELGIYRAPAGSSDFTKVLEGPVSCLSWTAQGVYACTSQAERGFALALIPSSGLLESALPTFEPLLSLPEVAGPLDCPACSSGAACSEAWRGVCLSWGRDDCELAAEEPAAQGGCPAQGGSGSADAGAPASGSPQGAAAAWGSEGGRPAVEPEPAAGASGCGCRSSAPTSPLTGVLMMLAGMLAARCRKRRRPH